MNNDSEKRDVQPRNIVLSGLRELLEIIRDYGMPTVAFGTGIYAFILVLEVEAAHEFKIAVALVLTLVGVLTQMWIYSRENPRSQSRELTDQLDRMTNLVEKLIENQKEKSPKKED